MFGYSTAFATRTFPFAAHVASPSPKQRANSGSWGVLSTLLCMLAASIMLFSNYALADDDIVGTPAPGSKFSKIQIGMHSKEVTDLIGMPNDQKGYATGKAFIPFHFGRDNYRMEYHYKGEGLLTFSGGGVGDSSLKLIRITVNPSESGYVRE